MYVYQHTHFPSLNVLTHKGLHLRSRSDRCADLTHQMSEAATEKASRILVRAVPLIYGVSLGALAGHLPAGLAVGIVVSAVLDLRLREESMLRPWLQPLLNRVYPFLAATMTKLAARLAAWGLKPPRFLLPGSSDLFSENKPV